MSKRIRYKCASKEKVTKNMKRTKVPIIVSGLLWVSNIRKPHVAKNLLNGRGSMAKKNQIFLLFV